MADWAVIADSALDPDAPLTSELAYGFRDNPIAIAEGAPGAPRVQGIAIDNIYAGSALTTGAASAAILSLGRVKSLRAMFAADFAGAGASMRLAYSSDNGSTFGSFQNFGPSNGVITNAEMQLDLVTGGIRIVRFDTRGVSTYTTTPLAGCNAFQIGVSAASGGFCANFWITAGRP